MSYRTKNANSNVAYEQRNFSIDSQKRSDTLGSISDFRHATAFPRDYDYDRVTCLQAEIPKAYYMLDADVSLAVVEDTGPTTITATLAGGRNYTVTELTAALKASLDAASITGGNSFTYTVAFSAATGKFTITISSGDFDFSMNQTSDDFTAFAKYLGFPISAGAYSSTSSVLVSPQMVNLQRHDVLYIRSDMANNGGDDILAEIYVGSTIDLAMIRYITPDAVRHSVGLSDSVSSCSRFSLTDGNGKLVVMNGINWRLVVQAFKSGQNID